MTEQEAIGVVKSPLKFGRPMNIELDMASAYSELIKDGIHLIGIEIREGRRVGPRIEAVVGPDPIALGQRNLKVELALGRQRLADPALIEIIDSIGPRSASPRQRSQEKANCEDDQSLEQRFHQSDSLSEGPSHPQRSARAMVD